ncbi:hypothetical protein S40285_05152 [Stachybotrys chlorohalonatus IBT 40285]|uniref:Uncharacterized protein n=1 Tax=Stachybotrys chlorohalonatus (strain IBT 40285) TaxID=1283841 RepID=A0A084QSV0_STAC4|nr:hypothetical protein S40285_05152 [Stachybotrys chlorohalonata IBT 40285]
MASDHHPLASPVSLLNSQDIALHVRHGGNATGRPSLSPGTLAPIMASSNPFRRKSPQGIERFPPIEAIDTSGVFAHHDPRAPASPAGAVDARQRAGTADSTASKTVKKVRIVSPPPLSPDSPEWPASVSAVAPSASAHSSSFSPSWNADRRFQHDSFTAAANAKDDDRDSTPSWNHSRGPPAGASTAGQPPPNPFGKTLQDLEDARLNAELQKERREEGDALKIGNAVGKSLNVDSFHRLLMTGSADYSGPPSSESSAVGDAVLTRDASTAGASSSSTFESTGLLSGDQPRQHSYRSERDASRRSAEDQDDEDDSSISDSSVNIQLGSRSSGAKKPAPPPPSSRHGKSLKFELKDDASISPPSSIKSPPSDVNKPLPQPPARNELHDENESPFDRESAGKVPELEPLQSPVPSQRKSIPAPPPRRGLSRSESKTQQQAPVNIPRAASPKAEDDDSSIGGGRSRSSSFRQGPPAPAPPPPRRLHGGAGSRQASGTTPTVTSPGIGQTPQSPPASAPVQDGTDESAQTSSSPEPASGGDVSNTAGAKISAPPPPPTRNASIRRPPSIHSVDSGVRHVAFEMKPRESMAPPPPAPRRQRGSSRSSVDGPPGRVGDASSRPRSTLIQDSSTNVGSPPNSGKGVDILADLTALQREVDALRGKRS